jgi:hypothetical protein
VFLLALRIVALVLSADPQSTFLVQRLLLASLIAHNTLGGVRSLPLLWYLLLGPLLSVPTILRNRRIAILWHASLL